MSWTRTLKPKRNRIESNHKSFTFLKWNPLSFVRIGYWYAQTGLAGWTWFQNVPHTHNVNRLVSELEQFNLVPKDHFLNSWHSFNNVEVLRWRTLYYWQMPLGWLFHSFIFTDHLTISNDTNISFEVYFAYPFIYWNDCKCIRWIIVDNFKASLFKTPIHLYFLPIRRRQIAKWTKITPEQQWRWLRLSPSIENAPPTRLVQI